MREMKSLSLALQKTLRSSASSDLLAAKAARAAKVKRMWKAALEACAGPAAAVILDHTNSVYIIRNREIDDSVSRETSCVSTGDSNPPAAYVGARPMKGRRQACPGELIVYVEDSLIAAEVDARREMIKLKFLELFGEELDGFRIRVSRGKYKLNHPYREEEKAADQKKVPREPLSEQQMAQINDELLAVPNERVREALKRAMISDLEAKKAEGAEKSHNGVL